MRNFHRRVLKCIDEGGQHFQRLDSGPYRKLIFSTINFKNLLIKIGKIP
jgi:hypothetical protein